jgi:hypothetical protein
LNDGCDDIFFASLGKLFHKVDAINENRRFPALDLAFGMWTLLFAKALVEWWWVGFSMTVLRHGGLTSYMHLKVCSRIMCEWCHELG